MIIMEHKGYIKAMLGSNMCPWAYRTGLIKSLTQRICMREIEARNDAANAGDRDFPRFPYENITTETSVLMPKTKTEIEC